MAQPKLTRKADSNLPQFHCVRCTEESLPRRTKFNTQPTLDLLRKEHSHASQEQASGIARKGGNPLNPYSSRKRSMVLPTLARQGQMQELLTMTMLLMAKKSQHPCQTRKPQTQKKDLVNLRINGSKTGAHAKSKRRINQDANQGDDH